MLRVLHIDDEPEVLATVGYTLLGFAEVTQAASLRAAQGQLAQSTFDLLLVDLNLSDSSGAATVAALAGHGVPIVVFSAVEDLDTLGESLCAGAEDYICKGGITPARLVARLRFAHERYQRARRERDAAARQRSSRRRMDETRFETLKPFITCTALRT